MGILGENPTVIKSKELDLNPDITDRWHVWLDLGLKKKNLHKIIDRFPLKRSCNHQAPQLNPEVDSFLQENTRKRDRGFSETQSKVGGGVVMAAVRQALTRLLTNKDNNSDKLELISILWDEKLAEAKAIEKAGQ